METDYIVGLTYADRLRLVTEARHQALTVWLNSEPISLTSLMGPMSDGPEWPAGAAWLAARRHGVPCIISDGLSDPFVERDKPEIGLGMEVFVESPDVDIPAQASAAKLADTWMFPLLAEISHTLAGYPRLGEKLLAGELLSLEFNIEHIKDGRGRVGALLNLPGNYAQHLDLPCGSVRLVPATLLTVAELRFLRGKGSSGRQILAEQLISAGYGYVSYLHRPSLY
ncbi:suppressor of fused domain protein [Methylomonas paludis]|uniref:Suppressor of fused domain protein n=1 Tax=Methylomonas paludis TaxID=1173101 RepID=A0A975MP47_9GAMM|nr:suppressor of fused domain protein [Methylomonas paludis]QWF71443.1 suppressor of fused domain protein [Methylomonas paludis]